MGRLRRVINKRRLMSAAGVLLGVAALGTGLAVLVMQPFAPTSTERPPQAGTISTPVPVAEQSIQAEPIPTSDAESPFAHIADPLPSPPRRTGMVTHEVKEGEVLWQIAEQYDVRPETILWANEIPDADLLLVGQQLLIPPEDGVLYTVRSGDRLADVAERYGVELSGIVEATTLGDAAPVQAGTHPF